MKCLLFFAPNASPVCIATYEFDAKQIGFLVNSNRFVRIGSGTLDHEINQQQSVPLA